MGNNEGRILRAKALQVQVQLLFHSVILFCSLWVCVDCNLLKNAERVTQIIICTCQLIVFNKCPSTTRTVLGILHILLLLSYLRAFQAKSDTLYIMPEETEGKDFEWDSQVT